MAKTKSCSKEERLERLRRIVQDEPMITDDELARVLGVSIHTIRADRQKLGIPEARQRTKDVAVNLFGKAKSLTEQEIIGELLEVELDKEGLSLLETSSEMGFKKSGIVRGHVMFAQANTLAAAVIDADVVLTGKAEVQFISTVKAGERILAKAQVVQEEGRKKEVEVVIKTKERLVFRGNFTMYGLTKEMAAHMNLLPQE
ncbi:MAG TPA: transcription factor FapR [Bacillota bacterium]|nr:transcription factor FapR [Bacillota bacterium]